VRERSVSAAGILAERTQFDAAKTKGSSFNGLAATDCSRPGLERVWIRYERRALSGANLRRENSMQRVLRLTESTACHA
jgi:hypothetical protein